MILKNEPSKESAYWLKLIMETNKMKNADEALRLIQEANELKKILSSILEKSKWPNIGIHCFGPWILNIGIYL